MRGSERKTEIEALIRRLEVLEHCCRSPAHVRDLLEHTDQSRSTINRAIAELEGVGFVERGENGFEATSTGRLSRDRLLAFLDELDDIRTAETVLDPLPADAGIDPDVVEGGEAILAADSVPCRPEERIHEQLADATHYRALIPWIDDPRHVRLLYEHVVTEGHPAELVVTPEVFRALRRDFPRRTAAMANEDGFTLFVGSFPSFGLSLAARESDSADVTTVVLAAFTEETSVHGVLVNESDSALEWAEERYERVRREATDRTNDLITDAA